MTRPASSPGILYAPPGDAGKGLGKGLHGYTQFVKARAWQLSRLYKQPASILTNDEKKQV